MRWWVLSSEKGEFSLLFSFKLFPPRAAAAYADCFEFCFCFCFCCSFCCCCTAGVKLQKDARRLFLVALCKRCSSVALIMVDVISAMLASTCEESEAICVQALVWWIVYVLVLFLMVLPFKLFLLLWLLLVVVVVLVTLLLRSPESPFCLLPKLKFRRDGVSGFSNNRDILETLVFDDTRCFFSWSRFGPAIGGSGKGLGGVGKESSISEDGDGGVSDLRSFRMRSGGGMSCDGGDDDDDDDVVVSWVGVTTPLTLSSIQPLLSFLFPLGIGDLSLVHVLVGIIMRSILDPPPVCVGRSQTPMEYFLCWENVRDGDMPFSWPT